MYKQIIMAGGPIMWVIAACSFIAVLVFVEKWLQFHRAQVKVGELVNGLTNVLKRDGYVEAITLCDNTPGPVARVLTAAIQAYQNDDDVKQAMDDASLTELPRLEGRLNILATIAYITPLLGLLGTVLGLAETFPATQATKGLYLAVSDGIRMALVTTAAGLCVAIPCHVAYNYLLSKVNSFCFDMEKASSEMCYFFKRLKEQRKNGGAPKGQEYETQD